MSKSNRKAKDRPRLTGIAVSSSEISRVTGVEGRKGGPFSRERKEGKEYERDRKETLWTLGLSTATSGKSRNYINVTSLPSSFEPSFDTQGLAKIAIVSDSFLTSSSSSSKGTYLCFNVSRRIFEQVQFIPLFTIQG